jgi:ATP-dependent Clp protease adaptor protein ClpS
VSGTERQRRGEVLERTERKTDEPRQVRVVLLNDDYTSMDFVVGVLESIFDRSPAEAYRIMMQVHTGGSGTAGRYPWEVAETKVDLVHDRAREAGYPLRASIEDD